MPSDVKEAIHPVEDVTQLHVSQLEVLVVKARVRLEVLVSIEIKHRPLGAYLAVIPQFQPLKVLGAV